MSHGLAVVSTDCPSGPGEIIVDDVNGKLVPSNDVQALADGIAALMSDKNCRRRLGNEARLVVERFSVTRTLERWDQMFGKNIVP